MWHWALCRMAATFVSVNSDFSELGTTQFGDEINGFYISSGGNQAVISCIGAANGSYNQWLSWLAVLPVFARAWYSDSTAMP
jgi:hypothetical protein